MRALACAAGVAVSWCCVRRAGAWRAAGRDAGGGAVALPWRTCSTALLPPAACIIHDHDDDDLCLILMICFLVAIIAFLLRGWSPSSWCVSGWAAGRPGGDASGHYHHPRFSGGSSGGRGCECVRYHGSGCVVM